MCVCLCTSLVNKNVENEVINCVSGGGNGTVCVCVCLRSRESRFEHAHSEVLYSGVKESSCYLPCSTFCVCVYRSGESVQGFVYL